MHLNQQAVHCVPQEQKPLLALRLHLDLYQVFFSITCRAASKNICFYCVCTNTGGPSVEIEETAKFMGST